MRCIAFLRFRPSTPCSTLERNSARLGSGESWKLIPGQSGGSAGTLGRSWHRSDDEHGLIARYTAKLAESQAEIGPAPEKQDGSSAHQLLAQLEVKNQEILREIARIRYGGTILDRVVILTLALRFTDRNKS